MNRGSIQIALALICLGIFSGASFAATSVQVLGLFKNAALLKIGDRQQLLRAGQTSVEGVKLVSADARKAVLRVDGREQSLALSEHIAGAFSNAEKQRVSLQRNLRNEYRTAILVNGRSTDAIVDTGANVIAFSRPEAERLGLRFLDAERAVVETASGIAQAWRITLDRVELSGIVVRSVPAVVVDGRAPETTLLGMSWLRHVELEDKSGVLYLQQRY